jgi:anti-sigma28 factor (negative regulator of flagellin synthesis)
MKTFSFLSVTGCAALASLFEASALQLRLRVDDTVKHTQDDAEEMDEVSKGVLAAIDELKKSKVDPQDIKDALRLLATLEYINSNEERIARMANARETPLGKAKVRREVVIDSISMLEEAMASAPAAVLEQDVINAKVAEAKAFIDDGKQKVDDERQKLISDFNNQVADKVVESRDEMIELLLSKVGANALETPKYKSMVERKVAQLEADLEPTKVEYAREVNLALKFD